MTPFRNRITPPCRINIKSLGKMEIESKGIAHVLSRPLVLSLAVNTMVFIQRMTGELSASVILFCVIERKLERGGGK